jgi:hypothetical protein
MERKQLVEIVRREERRKATEGGMTVKRAAALGMGGAAAAAALGAASYAAYAGATWLRYGRPAAPTAEQSDAFLDHFMPRYDVAERHQIGVAAPRDVTFSAMMDVSLQDSRVIRAIFKGREVLLGADAPEPPDVRSFVDMTKALGWRVLAEEPGREVVMGAVTQPWKANVVFRGLPPDEFPSFDQPGYVKIIWTLRVDADGAAKSVARTETRAIATDADARRRFRSYWARFSPGIILIRAISLRLVRKEAERRFLQRGSSGSSTEMVVPPAGGA